MISPPSPIPVSFPSQNKRIRLSSYRAQSRDDRLVTHAMGDTANLEVQHTVVPSLHFGHLSYTPPPGFAGQLPGVLNVPPGYNYRDTLRSARSSAVWANTNNPDSWQPLSTLGHSITVLLRPAFCTLHQCWPCICVLTKATGPWSNMGTGKEARPGAKGKHR